ncbi:hypothetical protein C8R44DRAFT_747157 [Mycena epipterygia]|nr:hypothetical protein C8R44DRAFT_747157 [Mycena epipterygia]
MDLFGFGLDLREAPLASRIRGYTCQCSRVEARIIEHGVAGINLKLVGIQREHTSAAETHAGCDAMIIRVWGALAYRGRVDLQPISVRPSRGVDMGSVEGRRYNVRTRAARKFESGIARARLQSNATHSS